MLFSFLYLGWSYFCLPCLALPCLALPCLAFPSLRHHAPCPHSHLSSISFYQSLLALLTPLHNSTVLTSLSPYYIYPFISFLINFLCCHRRCVSPRHHTPRPPSHRLTYSILSFKYFFLEFQYHNLHLMALKVIWWPCLTFSFTSLVSATTTFIRKMKTT